MSVWKSRLCKFQIVTVLKFEKFRSLMLSH